ncbi:Gfo/Idh/MocA family oxidoreductase [Opitutaceae bacterium]|nr:Gfo/Idh/MocA family oxidoreductase [Opitutaceae bacterium]
MSSESALSRRSFLQKTTLATAAASAFPAIVRGQKDGVAPTNRVNVAFVGVGGRGTSALQALADENFVAFCDVDDERAKESYEKYPDVPRFRDYREMFAEMADKIDAVVITTPDHMHFPIAMAALKHKMHLYVEKPLTHTVEEARLLTEAAREAGVVTQMGNQGHSNEGTRLTKEWIQAGVLGEIREVHSWTNRPVWPQGLKVPNHSKMRPVVPKTLDWDLWLGVAQKRAYDPAYLPFSWRGWWDFGCCAFGDMACHIMDAAYWGLDLGSPTALEAFSAKNSEQNGPVSSVVQYEFAARKSQPALTWKWYDGGLTPPFPANWEDGREYAKSGTMIIGSEASMVNATYGESPRIFPSSDMRKVGPKLPPKTLPRVETSNHHLAWCNAIRDSRQPASNFDYAGPFTETVLLGNAAIRANRRLDFDAKNVRFTNYEPANAYLTKDYRPGFY